MKKFKTIVLTLVMVLAMAVLTGCGVEEPTLEDVEEALADEGYLPEEDEDKDEDKKDEATTDEEGESSEDASKDEDAKDKVEWSVKIDKCKLNDDKDKADVDATLTVKNAYTETTTEFEIEFKLRDNKSWKCRDVEKGDSETKLIAGVPDDEIPALLEWQSVYIEDINDSGNSVSLYGDEIESITVDSHEEDLENMKDVVTVTIKGTEGFFEVEAKAKVTCVFFSSDFDNYWYVEEFEVADDYSVEYTDAYNFELTEDEITQMIIDDGDDVYFLSDYYYFDEGDISELTYEKVEPDGGYYLTMPVSFMLSYDKISMQVEADVEFYFNGSEWELNWIYNATVTEWDSEIIGTWTGTVNDTDKVTIEVPDTLDEYGDLYATVTIDSAEKGKFQYSMQLYYYPADGEISTYFDEWIVQPADGDYYAYEDFDGVIGDGKWESDSSWYNFQLTKSEGGAVSEPEVDEVQDYLDDTLEDIGNAEQALEDAVEDAA